MFSHTKFFCRILCFLILILFQYHTSAQVKILFDATKAETAGSADWVIDADNNNLSWNPGPIPGGGSESNAQRFPTPMQSGITASTTEDFWTGALSFWGIDCVNKGYEVETLPYTSSITYGNTNNPQDLKNYKVFIICEPNIKFTDAEKTAILSFVNNGGGLFMISDHDVSDRNNDGWDSPHIWNDLLQNNSTGNTNPFGIIFDYSNFSETSSKLAALPITDSILHGPMGNVTKVKWSNGTAITTDPAANQSVKPVIYRTSVSSATGNINIMVADARYGRGKVVAIGDSSPCDDGTGDPNDILYTGYNGDVTPNHRNLLMNATIWLATTDKYTYTFTGNGNWSDPNNWSNNIIPPSSLPAGDTINIDPAINGECILDITEHILSGATLNIATGKNLLVPGLLNIQ